MQSGAFFWGSFRSGGDAFLRTAGAATSRWRPAFAGCDHARSLLAGSEQPRFWPGNERFPTRTVVFLCLSERRDGFAEAKACRPAGETFSSAAAENCPAATTSCADVRNHPMKSSSTLRRAPTTPPRRWRKWDRARFRGKQTSLAFGYAQHLVISEP